jgi:outer membrane protein OmpA-like peptidoglycan-associated protein
VIRHAFLGEDIMAVDWAENVKKYAANADDEVIAGIVRYCGIALQKRDSSLVSFSDPKETSRVRENFLKKKLALTEPDSVLDDAIAAVGQVMKGENFKNRVTVYYLLADRFGLLEMFRKKARAIKDPAATAGSGAGMAAAGAGAAALGLAGLVTGSNTDADSAPEPAAAVPTPTPAPTPTPTPAAALGGAALAGAAAAVAATGAVASDAAAAASTSGGAAHALTGNASAVGGGAATPAQRPAAAQVAEDRESGFPGWLLWLLLGLLLLGLLWWLFFRDKGDSDAAPASAEVSASAPASATGSPAAAASGAVDLAAAPAEGSVTIPAGAGVISEMRNGKPVVKVYFDTASTTVTPDFAATAEGLKAYLAANAGSTLAISGYNDASGNAAANAELSENRAQAVQAALIAAGIPEATAALVKPENNTDTSVPAAAARRVEVTVVN